MEMSIQGKTVFILSQGPGTLASLHIKGHLGADSIKDVILPV